MDNSKFKDIYLVEADEHVLKLNQKLAYS